VARAAVLFRERLGAAVVEFVGGGAGERLRKLGGANK